MDTSKIVGEKIKSLRESQSISMEELAQRSGLAIEQIERIENNIDLPSLAPGEAQVAVRVNDIFFVWCCFGPMFQPLAEGTFV